MSGRPGYLEVLRECPDFRRLFTARVVSLLGDWFSLIATLALLRELVGTSPSAISGVLILKLLPIFLAGPIAGVVADRFSRKRIMLLSDIARIGLVLALIVTPSLPSPVTFAYVLIALQVAASAFFEPARTAALPQLVPARYLATANALGAVAWSVVFALGAALGGLVADALGWRVALLVDAATYVVSAAFVLRIRLPRRESRKTGPANWADLTGWTDLRDGIRFLARRRDVATVLLVKSGWGLAGAVTLFLTLFGESKYALAGRPDLGVALFYFSRAVGTGIGPVLVRWFVPDESIATLRTLLAAAILWPGLWYLAFTLVDHWALAALCVVVAHFGGSVLWVYSTLLLQRLTPNEYLGRVISTEIGLATLAISISLWTYGRLAEQPGANPWMLLRILAISLIVPFAAWWFASRRWLRDPEPD